MVYSFDFLTATLVAVLSATGLVLLLVRTDRTPRLTALARRGLRRLTGRGDLDDLRWWHVALPVGAGLIAVIAYDLATGLFGCPAPGHPSDIGGFLAQGRALWTGGDPFNVPSCGATIQEPDGLASVVINGLASFGGVAGIAIVWAAIALTIVPLTWRAAGGDRQYLTLVVASSPLYAPLVAAQIDGASNALVPVTILLTIVLAVRTELGAAGIAGFLATQRFPTLFPILGLSGSFRRKFAIATTAIAIFAAGTGICYAIWGSEFLGPVFLSQLGRRSFSLNFWGVLLLNNLLPAGEALTIGQAVVTLALVGVVFFRVRSPLRAAALTVTGVALLSQFLSFNILVWLLPVALVGVRPRWWLWGIALVGSVNYSFALSIGAWGLGIVWPSEVLDVVLTLLLLGLFVDLWRSPDRPGASESDNPPPQTESDSGRIIMRPGVPRSDAAFASSAPAPAGEPNPRIAH
ncbi:MAG: hypothetical protein L3K23_08745 [Thermoplasmata archaeon]|nr:hypothetical protein [Thermoplasmata archaeon]